MNELLYANGRIHTLDPASPLVDALAVRDGRILAAGRAEDLRSTSSNFRRIDLARRTVLPGFTDSHIHLPAYGLSLQRVDLTGTRSVREAVDRVRGAVERAAPGEWVRGRGWDKNLWVEDRFPTRADLDPVAPSHPVILSSKDGHLLWVNTAALRAAGMDRTAGDPPGGEITRDARGEPVGLLKESAKDLILRAVPPADDATLERAIRSATGHMHTLGITAVHNFTGTDPSDGAATFAAFQRLAARGELRLRVWLTIPERAIEAAAGIGLRTGFGNEWLRVGPVKIFADGTLGSQTAAMIEPFVGQRNTGIAIHTREELVDLVRRATASGFWCAIHAIGDRANRWVLDAFEANVEASRHLGARHRIEHVQLIHPDDLPRLARLGVTASMQPIHATSDRDIADRYWGARSRTAYAWRSLRQAGTVLAFGSDAPVESPDVFQGLFAAVTRRRVDDPQGEPWYPLEALTIDGAVAAYTTGAAYAAGMEAACGRLAEGMVADFIVLDRDPYDVAPDDLPRIRVEGTVLAGEIVYASPAFSGG